MWEGKKEGLRRARGRGNEVAQRAISLNRMSVYVCVCVCV